jgi:hypothetical protein
VSNGVVRHGAFLVPSETFSIEEQFDRILWMGVLCLVTWGAYAPRH